jgi:hypothetical protein
MKFQRDLRTALEKWEDARVKARVRGHWYKLDRPLPQELLGGWDRTWLAARSPYKPDVTAARWEPKKGYRDESKDTLVITVTTYLPLSDSKEDVPKIRTSTLTGLPYGKQPKDLQNVEEAVESTVGRFTNIDKVGGPRWKEWCAWEDQYNWTRFTDIRLRFQGPQPIWHRVTLGDLRYAKVLRHTERDEDVVAASQNLERFYNYVDRNRPSEKPEYRPTYNNGDNMKLLPQTWDMVKSGTFYCSERHQDGYHEYNEYKHCEKLVDFSANELAIPLSWLERMHNDLKAQLTEIDEMLSQDEWDDMHCQP